MPIPPTEYCPLCHSPAVILVYGKACRTASSSGSLPENTCFGGCMAFPDENGMLADRMCPVCGHEWVASSQPK